VFPAARYRRFRVEERALLDALLAGNEPGFDVLRSQLASASYKAPWFPGSVSFEIHVAEGLPLAGRGGEDGQGEGQIIRAQNVYRHDAPKVQENLIGSIFLWVADGMLSGLEYASANEGVSTSLPTPAQLGD